MMWWGFWEPETKTWRLTFTAQMKHGLISLLPVRWSPLVSVQTTQLVWLAFYCSVATPAQVGHCDVSKVKAPWENTRLMFEGTSLRGNLRKLASQRSCTRCTVSLLVCGRWRLFAFQMQPLFSDCLHNREWSHVAVFHFRFIDEARIVHVQLNFSA